MATWIKEQFYYAPRLQLFGALASGKSRLLGVLESLSYRAIKTAGLTQAVFFRIVSGFGVTLLRDESQDEFGDVAIAVNQTEKLGFEQRGKILRCDIDDPNIPKCFRPYCYVARSYLDEKPKRDSLSRGPVISMMNKPYDYSVLDPEDFEDGAELLRGRLLAFRIRVLTGKIDLMGSRGATEEMYSKAFGNRNLDISVPLGTIANLYGYAEEVAKTITRSQKMLDSGLKDDVDAQVFYAIQRVYNRQPIKPGCEKGTLDVAGKPRKFDFRDVTRMTTNDVIRQFNDTLGKDAIDSGTAEVIRYRIQKDHGTGEDVEVPEYRLPKVAGQRVTSIITSGLGFTLSAGKKGGNKRGFDPASFYSAYERRLERYGEVEG